MVKQKGFTLIELLIVIGIVAVLATAVVLTLNPAELLRQSRDSTRLSDLGALRSALALYLADESTPAFGGSANCYVHPAIGAGNGCLGRFTAVIGGSTAGGTNTPNASVAVSGGGWIPVNLTTISAGTPISALPIDPVNNATALFYAFRPSSLNQAAACTAAAFDCTEYEVNAALESAKFKTDEDIDGTDGGNSTTLYEVGTDSGLDL